VETPAIEGRGLRGITITPPRKPLLAAVEGWALAGGFELVLACDLVVAGRTAGFGVPEIERSLVAAGGAALLLPQRVPRAVALEMLLTGEPIDAERAAAVGLATTRIVQEAPSWSPKDAWTRHDEIVLPVFASEDAREGSTAFAERRAPVWRNR
jgi:enoyl-CoA hydratase